MGVEPVAGPGRVNESGQDRTRKQRACDDALLKPSFPENEKDAGDQQDKVGVFDHGVDKSCILVPASSYATTWRAVSGSLRVSSTSFHKSPVILGVSPT